MAVARIARDQYGLVSRRQGMQAGLSKSAIHRRIRSGEWEPVLPGVYRLSSAPVCWRQRLLAACLWAGEGAVASHKSAAAIWRMDGFAEGPVEISAPKTLRRQSWITSHQVKRLHPADLAVVDGIPVTNPTRTLFDLGAVARREALEVALDSALRRSLTSLPRVRWAMSQRGRGCRGSRALRRLLEDRSPGNSHTESALEVRIRLLFADAGLPPPKLQHQIRENGKVVARVDFAYPQALLAIEADGYRYHSGRAAWQYDRTRSNALVARGWRVLRITSEDLRSRSAEVVAEVRRTLRLGP